MKIIKIVLFVGIFAVSALAQAQEVKCQVVKNGPAYNFKPVKTEISSPGRASDVTSTWLGRSASGKDVSVVAGRLGFGEDAVRVFFIIAKSATERVSAEGINGKAQLSIGSSGSDDETFDASCELL